MGRPGTFTFYCDIIFVKTFRIAALALGLSSELPTLCGQLARRSTAKLCHNQVHTACGSHRSPGSHPLFIIMNSLSQSITFFYMFSSSVYYMASAARYRLRPVSGGNCIASPWLRGNIARPTSFSSVQVSVSDIYHTMPYHHTMAYQLRYPSLAQASTVPQYVLPSTSMVDSVTGLRYAECSHAPDYVTDGYACGEMSS